MVELLRYIEHAFARAANTDEYIDVSNDSNFQVSLRDMRSSVDAQEKMKQEAGGYLSNHFSTGESPISQPGNYQSLYQQVKSAKDLTVKNTKALIEQIFDTSLRKTLQSDAWKKDEEILSNSIVALKLFPDFAGADPSTFVNMRQAIALAEVMAATDDKDDIDFKKLLSRLILVPISLLYRRKKRLHQTLPPYETLSAGLCYHKPFPPYQRYLALF